MVNVNKWRITSLVLAIIGAVFSMLFQSMAYWGSHGSFTWTGFWVGAILSYFFAFSSIVCMFLNKDKLDIGLGVINLILVMGSMLWTTFIIIAWQSGM